MPEGNDPSEALARLRLLRAVGLATTLGLAIVLYLATSDVGRLFLVLFAGTIVSLGIPWLQGVVIRAKLTRQAMVLIVLMGGLILASLALFVGSLDRP